MSRPLPLIPRRRILSLLRVVFHGLALTLWVAKASAQPRGGEPLPPWQPGWLDIHHINTGCGDAAFFVLPDGTTLLVDAGAVSGRKRPEGYDSPQRPNATRRPGEWIAHYIRQHHPSKTNTDLDYALLTHFDEDHMGTVTEASPLASHGMYRLSGITDVGDQIPIHRMLDRAWPSYHYPRAMPGLKMENYRAFLRWQKEKKAMSVEAFAAGRHDQIVLVHHPERYPEFEIFNLAVNGRIWEGATRVLRDRFPEIDPPSENNSSTAFRLRYGNFRYYTGGDLAGPPQSTQKTWRDMESALAWLVGPVDVHVMNHHGTEGSVNNVFLSVLKPRVHIASTYASSQPGSDLLKRVLSEENYPGPRDVFLTNGLWEGRWPNMVTLFGEEQATWLATQLDRGLTGVQGHIVVRVIERGARYYVIRLDDQSEAPKVLAVHGPYLSAMSAL
ncbi:MAG TPA: hypothetical protein PLN52_00705 [Opitutaceae bacterium]|nr:hypothetical protein [Opitutaceae bacterium]